MRSTAIFAVPDFIVMGMKMDDKCVVMASSDLGKAEIEAIVNQYDLMGDFRTIATHGVTRYQVTAEMLTFKIVYADSYEEAFSNLWDNWKPDKHVELSNRKALPQ